MTGEIEEKNADLVRRFLAGGQGAFVEIVHLHERQVFAVLRGIVPDEYAVEDLAQEVFLEAFRNLPSLREPEKLGAWLAGIARRMAFRYVTRRRIVSDIEEQTMVLSDPEDEPEFHFLKKERKTEIWAAVMSLPEKMRQAAVMFYYHELTVAEIARSLSLPRGTVTRRLFDARAKLKERLQDMNEKKRAGKEMSADAVPAGFAQEVKRQIEKIRVYYVGNGRVRDEKVEQMFDTAESYIDSVPDVQEKAKKSALAALYTAWGGTPEHKAKGYALAEESGNGVVLVGKMVTELLAMKDYGKWLCRIDEEMLPKMERLGCDEGKGELLFWRARAMIAGKAPMQEIAKTLAEAARLLPEESVMQAAAVCGCRTAAFAIENAKDPFEGFSVTAAQCRMEGGAMLYLCEPGFSQSRERVWRFSRFSALDYYAACGGKMLFDTSMKPGEIRTWGEGESLLLVSREESVTVPAGQFDSCMHISYREDGFSAETWYAEDVGLVRAVFSDDSNSESYELAEFERHGGEGYFPMAAGNRWRYQNPTLPEEFASFLELSITWTDGVTVNLSSANTVTPKKGCDFPEDSETLVDRCDTLCAEGKVEEALEALRLALRVNTSEPGAQAALGGIDYLTRFAEYAKKGYRLCPSSFNQYRIVKKDGRVREISDLHTDYHFGPYRYGTRHAEDRIFGVKTTRYQSELLDCVWDDKWAPGYHEENNAKKNPFSDGEEPHRLSFTVSDGGSVTVPAGTFGNCIKLTLDYGEKSDVPAGYFKRDSQLFGRKEYYLAPGVGLVKLDCDWGESLQSSCVLVSYQNPARAEGYYPLAIGCAWEYDEVNLTAEGYRAKRIVNIPCGRNDDYLIHDRQEFLYLGTEEEYDAFKERIGEGESKKKG